MLIFLLADACSKERNFGAQGYQRVSKIPSEWGTSLDVDSKLGVLGFWLQELSEWFEENASKKKGVWSVWTWMICKNHVSSEQNLGYLLYMGIILLRYMGFVRSGCKDP